MSRVSIVYIISDVDKALEFEWVAERLDRTRFDLSFLLLNRGDSALERFLNDLGVRCRRIAYRSKRDAFGAFFQIYREFSSARPDVVHTHLRDATVIGLAAAKAAGIARRIYTRHHSTLHHVYHPHAVAYDRLANWLATDVVAISKTTERVLREREGVCPGKIHLIHHGLALRNFLEVPAAAVESLRAKYNPRRRSPVIGVCSRYAHWKGLQYIVPAFRELLSTHPDAILILANAKRGDHAAHIQELLSALPRDSYVEVEFETDNAALFRLFDVFVHAPVDDHSEAFGQVYVEALASGTPSVFTLSGIANDFVRDGRNALVVGHKSSEQIHAALRRLLSDPRLTESLRKQGRADVADRFTLDRKVHLLEELYSGTTPQHASQADFRCQHV